MGNIESAPTRTGHSLLAKLFHWGFALLFIYGVIKQVDDINQLEDFALLRFEVMFAAAFLLLLAVRFIYMTKTQKSSLPDNTSHYQKLAAKIVHLGMYVTFAAIAGTGLLIGLFFWLGLKNGFLIDVTIGIHGFSVTLIYWLIAVHVVAAIYHRFKRDGVWSSMVPLWKEPDKSHNS
ncbi:MAG: cytochrome b/b6 domain-containing protein [Albidovulum sp.]|nr:cytochrome b/b6 domain-containing protein [Albidovulum sp.]